MRHTGFALLFALTMAVAAIGIQGTARADVIIIIRDGSAVTQSYYGQPYPYQAPAYGESAYYESVPRPPAPSRVTASRATGRMPGPAMPRRRLDTHPHRHATGCGVSWPGMGIAGFAGRSKCATSRARVTRLHAA